MGIAQLIVSLAPTIVGLGERLFSHKPKSGPEKAQLAMNIMQTAIVTALGIAPGAFGPDEQNLIKSVNDAVVAYYNAKGWPTQ